MSEGAAEDRGWGGGGGGGVWGEEAACVWAKKQRLPVTSEQVCVFRDLGKEGHTHTQTDTHINCGGGAPAGAAVFKVQRMRDNWSVPIGREGRGGRVLAVAHFLSVILK